ncbi:hypothetical protein KKG05_00725 [bacterium]|nr:hypothetical protein [bacterium]
MQHIRSKTWFAVCGLLAFASASFSANLTIHGGITPIGDIGATMGVGLELKPIAGRFLIPEIATAFTRGMAQQIVCSYRYSYYYWKDYHGAVRLKVQGIVPHNPFFFALGIGVGFHYVGADNWQGWHYQSQLRAHGFTQINLRLTPRDSMFLEIELASQLRDLPEPKKFPLGHVALKLGWRFHSI